MKKGSPKYAAFQPRQSQDVKAQGEDTVVAGLIANLNHRDVVLAQWFREHRTDSEWRLAARRNPAPASRFRQPGVLKAGGVGQQRRRPNTGATENGLLNDDIGHGGFLVLLRVLHSIYRFAGGSMREPINRYSN